MIVEEGKYYIYRHITLKGNVFYIGRGTKWHKRGKNKTIYDRAFSKKDRTSFWNKTVKKYGYEVEILVESNNFNFICEKEKEFIKLYGRRKIDKGGTLVNFTEGGEKECPRGGLSRKKRVYMYNLEGKYIKSFNSIMSASRRFNCSSGTILICCRNKQKQYKGYQFRLFWSQDIGKVQYKQINGRKVICINILTGEETIYLNTRDVHNKLGINMKTLGNNLCSLSKIVMRKYKFKYLENE